MKKRLASSNGRFVVAFLSLLLGMGPTPLWGQTQEGKAPPPKSDPATAAKAKKIAKEKEAASLLNGTKWSIEMVRLSGEKSKKPLKDTLTFEESKVTSVALSKEGYPTTNYTLTVGEDGVPIWETMQTKEEVGVVFWRGERHGETMRGIVSRQPTGESSADFSFSGKLVEAKPAAAPPAASSPPVSTAATFEAASAKKKVE